MGRLEKQIITGAIALVAILLGIVVAKGIDKQNDGGDAPKPSEWQNPGLVVPPADPEARARPEATPEKRGPFSAPESGATLIPLTLAEPGADAGEREAETAPSRPRSSQDSTSAPSRPGTSASPQPGRGAARQLPLQDEEDALRRYEVQPGETLGEIAQRELGSLRDLDLIEEVNEGIDVDHVDAGDVIWLPSRAVADARRAGKEAARKSEASSAPAASQGAGADARIHVVAAGDSLWEIAAQYYGKDDVQAGVRRIVAANAQLPDENTVLRLDWKLRVPR